MTLIDSFTCITLLIVTGILLFKQLKHKGSLHFIILSFILLSFVEFTNILEYNGLLIWDKFEDPIETLFLPLFIFAIFSYCIRYELKQNRAKEAELVKAKERIEKEERLKTAFLYNLSHEIRTPMNGIIGFSEILTSDSITKDEQRDYVQLIANSCHNLTQVVDDIIEISKITVGDLSIVHRNVEINSLLTRLHKAYLPMAQSKNLDFELITSQKDCFVFSDESKLYRIIENLLNNALKFTSKGKVSYGYQLIGKEVSFFVEDTGIGISKEHHREVFENFRQVESNFSRRYGGTGLGLSISKGLVEVLGGKLHLYSELGRGTRVSFSLPGINRLNK